MCRLSRLPHAGRTRGTGENGGRSDRRPETDDHRRRRGQSLPGGECHRRSCRMAVDSGGDDHIRPGADRRRPPSGVGRDRRQRLPPPRPPGDRGERCSAVRRLQDGLRFHHQLDDALPKAGPQDHPDRPQSGNAGQQFQKHAERRRGCQTDHGRPVRSDPKQDAPSNRYGQNRRAESGKGPFLGGRRERVCFRENPAEATADHRCAEQEDARCFDRHRRCRHTDALHHPLPETPGKRVPLFDSQGIRGIGLRHPRRGRGPPGPPRCAVDRALWRRQSGHVRGRA